VFADQHRDQLRELVERRVEALLELPQDALEDRDPITLGVDDEFRRWPFPRSALPEAQNRLSDRAAIGGPDCRAVRRSLPPLSASSASAAAFSSGAQGWPDCFLTMS
jgi:hypothetical protein